MKTNIFKNDHFRKWSLFFGLVLALGFNLSWNPQLINIARNEFNSIDLAQQASPGDVTRLKNGDPALSMYGKTFNLGQLMSDDSLKDYGVEFVKNPTSKKDDQTLIMQLKKKVEGSEGYTVTCKSCYTEQISVNVGFQGKEDTEFKAIISALMLKKEFKDKLQSLRSGSQVNGKTDNSGVENKDFAEVCRDKDEADLYVCQAEELEKLSDCQEKGCKSKAAALFKPIEKAFKACTSTKKSKKDEESELDCDEIKDIAADLVGENLSKSIVKKSILFREKYEILMPLDNLKKQLDAANVLPLDKENRLKMAYSQLSGTIALNPATNQWMQTKSPIGGVGKSIYDSLLTSDLFKSEKSAYTYYIENFQKQQDDIKNRLFANPQTFNSANINWDAESFSNGAAPNIFEFRNSSVRGASTALPPYAGPVINGTNGGAPQQQPQQQLPSPTGGLRSPRGQ